MSTFDLTTPVGFNKLVGFRLVEWEVGKASAELNMTGDHLNGLGIAHGGVLLAGLDYVLGMSGCYRAPPEGRRLCMTITLTSNFISPLKGPLLRANARVTGGGKTIFFVEGEIVDGDNKLIASATGSFRRLKDNPAT